MLTLGFRIFGSLWAGLKQRNWAGTANLKLHVSQSEVMQKYCFRRLHKVRCVHVRPNMSRLSCPLIVDLPPPGRLKYCVARRDRHALCRELTPTPSDLSTIPCRGNQDHHPKSIRINPPPRL